MLWKDTWDKSVSTQRYSILCLYCYCHEDKCSPLHSGSSLDASKQILVSDGWLCVKFVLDSSAIRIYVRNTHLAIWNPRIWFYMTFSGLLYTCMGLNTHYWPGYLIQWAVSLRIKRCGTKWSCHLSDWNSIKNVELDTFNFNLWHVVHKVLYSYLLTNGNNRSLAPITIPEQTSWRPRNCGPMIKLIIIAVSCFNHALHLLHQC